MNILKKAGTGALWMSAALLWMGTVNGPQPAQVNVQQIFPQPLNLSGTLPPQNLEVDFDGLSVSAAIPQPEKTSAVAREIESRWLAWRAVSISS